MKILDPQFWRSLIGPITRTAIAAITPFLAIIIASPFARDTWLTVIPVVILAVVFAIANALTNLSDTTGPWWQIALQRSARQAGQFFLASVIPGVAFGDINWKFILTSIALSAITTFVLAAVSIVAPDPVALAPVIDPGYVEPVPVTVVPATPVYTGSPIPDAAQPVLPATDPQAYTNL